MKSHLLAKISTYILCFGMLFWSGCANFLKPEIGMIVWHEARIPLTENGVKNTIYEAKDLIITYALSGAGESFTLSGSLVFDRSLTDSFPVITKFFLKMSFLDNAGRVIETIDITPIFHVHSRVPEKLDLRVSRVPPEGSKSIAFNYFGVFRTTALDSSESWEIYSFPFD